MVVGDNFGQSGLGYNEGNYSDYKQTFNSAKNPNKLDIPDDFKGSSSKVTPLSKAEIEKQLRLRQSSHPSNSGGSRSDFNSQEQILIERQKQEMRNKAEQDRQFILQYQNLFDPQTIQDALNGGLITSADYQTFDSAGTNGNFNRKN
jgi:hypothetical protein